MSDEQRAKWLESLPGTRFRLEGDSASMGTVLGAHAHDETLLVAVLDGEPVHIDRARQRLIHSDPPRSGARVEAVPDHHDSEVPAWAFIAAASLLGFLAGLLVRWSL